MKRSFLLGTMALGLVFPSAVQAAESPGTKIPGEAQVSLQELQEGFQQAIGELMTIMGTMGSGMAQGMKQGADTLQSELDGLDGAKVISSAAELQGSASVRVYKVEERDGKCFVTLAVKNSGDVPLRLAGLNREQQVLLLDEEGFAHAPVDGLERTLSVPARAAVKQTYVFSGLEGKAKSLRLYGVGFPVDGAPAFETL